MNEVIEVNKIRVKKGIKFLTDEELWSKFIAEGLEELKDEFGKLKLMEIPVFINDSEVNRTFFGDKYEVVKNKKIIINQNSTIMLFGLFGKKIYFNINIGNFITLYFNDMIEVNIINEKVSKKIIDEKNKWKKYKKKYKDDINLQNRVKNQINQYIEKDKYRFNGENYSNKIYDINKGSWDLYEVLDKNNVLICHDKNEKYEEVMLDSPIYARNPKQDIVKSGVVGIDFGTRSTVVASYRDDNQGINKSKAVLIRISGNSDGIGRSENYENLTIIHFDDIENFMSEYNSKSGRPNTLYEDIQVSLEAYNEFKKMNSDDYDIYEFMTDLKQWAASKNINKKIEDSSGNQYTIKGYMELCDNDFDPIEIYAYYIGCRVNDMARNSIYLEYYLSFPVTYEESVKNRILKSFEKGIKKSLPESILKNKEIMKNFKISFGASEPASYAIAAFKKFCIEPDINNEIGYSVFDFGGGTTDFSYGIYREKENSRKYDYEIRELESGGDKYLGGENLLSLVAFDLFVQNKEKLVKNGYKIELPKNKGNETGFEAFTDDTYEAEYNMKSLMESMRNYWEGNLEKEDIDKGKISVHLNKGAFEIEIIELDVDYDRLDDLLRERIYKGVSSFVNKFEKIFKNKKLKTNYVFLAGNSSKSRFVEELFAQEMDKEMKKKYNIIIKDARAIEEESEIIGLNAKTAVAYGLTELREGNGEVEYIKYEGANNEEINFKYCIGYSKKKRLVPIIDFYTKYNNWIKYDDISKNERIEILYSDNVKAEGKEFSAEECSRIRIINNGNSGELYIRLKSPDTIEYVICEGIKKIDKKNIITESLK